jgi:exopolysaccharide biosynthesis predicted pyruvyltransferase EpsI
MNRCRFTGVERLDSVVPAVAPSGTVLTVRPGGNHGDTLIYRGFDKYADEVGLDRVRFDERYLRFWGSSTIPSRNVLQNFRGVYRHGRGIVHRLLNDVSAVYIHGGGNFGDLWGSGIVCYRTVARYFDCPIVVGPQSCRFTDSDPADVFRGVRNETYFFCREEYSYDVVREATERCDHVTVYPDHDTALYLDRADLPVDTVREEYTLLAMRMDQESADPRLAADISGPVRVRDVSTMAATFDDWVDTVARAGHVYTDRLHVGILAAILEKPTTLYETR